MRAFPAFRWIVGASLTDSFSEEEEEERGDRSTEVERRGEDRDTRSRCRPGQSSAEIFSQVLMKYFQVFRNILTEMFMLIIQRVR